MLWYGYGESVGPYTVKRVEAVARSLEERGLQEHSTLWNEAARQMRAAEIIHEQLGVGAELELPNGLSIYIEGDADKNVPWIH